MIIETILTCGIIYIIYLLNGRKAGVKKSFAFQLVVFMIWIVCIPLSIYTVYQYYPPNEATNWPLLAGFTALSLLTSAFPAFINGTPFFLTQWVSLALFLRFGLFIEIVVFQISLVPLLYNLKLNRNMLYRIPWNSIMFFLVSLLSGLAFLWLGGDIHSMNTVDIVGYGLLYIVVNITANHALIKISGILLGQRIRFFTIDDTWDYLICAFALPMGISLYLLGEYVGMLSIVLLGIPFYMATCLLQLYTTTNKVNKELSEAAHFGHHLADQLDSEETLDLFIERVPKMVSIDGLYLIDRRQQTGTLSVLRAYENGNQILKNATHKELSHSLLSETIKSAEKTVFCKREEWLPYSGSFLLPNTQSALVLPFCRNHQLEGVLLLTSRKKNSFQDYQVKMLELISSYFIVSLEKARYVEKAKHSSERCGLTGLYNYRYFEDYLNAQMNDLKNCTITNLSLIMLDIDYFKGINDRYGHESGNEILRGLAAVLKREVGEKGTLARYGGEEFVILLPNYTKQQALQLAEKLRQRIEMQPFEIVPDLLENVKHLIVHITASIGVSSAFEDTDNATNLLRNADHAMYKGAKEQGRNKVAGF